MANPKQPAAAKKTAAAKKAEAKAQAEELECEVLEPLRYDGAKYMPGDFIYLEPTEAVPMSEKKLIRFSASL